MRNIGELKVSNNLGLFVLTFIVFANPWIWRIFSFNFFLGVLVVLCAILLYFSSGDPLGCFASSRMTKEKDKFKTQSKRGFIFLFLLLLFFQWKTTEKTSLTNLTNSDIMVRDMRLNEYPLVKISLAGKTVWVPVAHWFEGRHESIAFFRMSKNFSEVIDPNLYFFGNHPRERVGYQEFEKFSYILLPFFVYGVLSLAKKKKATTILLWTLASLLALSVIGNRNDLGPFSLFPVITALSTVGLNEARGGIKKKYGNKYKYFVYGFIAIYLLIFVQMISYANA